MKGFYVMSRWVFGVMQLLFVVMMCMMVMMNNIMDVWVAQEATMIVIMLDSMKNFMSFKKMMKMINFFIIQSLSLVVLLWMLMIPNMCSTWVCLFFVLIIKSGIPPTHGWIFGNIKFMTVMMMFNFLMLSKIWIIMMMKFICHHMSLTMWVLLSVSSFMLMKTKIEKKKITMLLPILSSIMYLMLLNCMVSLVSYYAVSCLTVFALMKMESNSKKEYNFGWIWLVSGMPPSPYFVIKWMAVISTIQIFKSGIMAMNLIVWTLMSVALSCVILLNLNTGSQFYLIEPLELSYAGPEELETDACMVPMAAMFMMMTMYLIVLM